MEKVKLNLGCGIKLYPSAEGWVNVDIIEQDKVKLIDSVDANTLENVEIDRDTKLFHQSYLQKMPFIEDNVADEVHAYHVIEHFFMDESLGILEEWKRVLKPKGVIVLEQPDLLKCCANLLAGTLGGHEKLEFNLGFLGIYGAGTKAEPFMGHKCGWTPSSLGKALNAVGFENIRLEDAQHHAGKIRDFRMTAEKPNE